MKPIKKLSAPSNSPICRTYRRSRWRFNYGNAATYSALPNLRGLPARRLDKKGTTVITDELMAYDQDANPVCVRDSTTGNPGSRDFTYDARDRLIKASAPNQAWVSSEYQYDSQDNIKLARLGARQYNYTQNALNQLANITQPASAPSAVNYGLGACADASMSSDLSSSYTGPTVAIPSPGTPGTASMAGTQTAKYAFSHDAEGRMTAKGTQAYVYDALNRMSQVTGKESYLYDGHGRRVQSTKTSDGSINYPLYGLSGKLLLEDNRQTLTRTEYIFAGGRLVAKKIQPITAAGVNNGAATTTYIHTDFLGSPVAETNSAGTVTRIERYTPYGEPSDMQLDAGPGFTGHATDIQTGLTYMQQRYYDPELARFISPDPVGPEEDFIKHFNRYNYALNNPVRYTDPDGREVMAIYSNDNNSLFMIDNNTRKWAYVQAESGGKPYGSPIPAGSYSILERAGRSSYYRLESKDSQFGDDATPDGRTNLRLHGPGRTLGCVSLCNADGISQIDGLLKSTSTSSSEVNDKSIAGRITGGKETLKNFGSMHSLPSGYSVRFNEKTGNVSIRHTETGSRIAKERVICTAQKDGTCK